ncbi:MAG: 16S rRNA (cytosine(967)-C(5))-methyltransferase RsmB [Candidatus Schmidhempelia sp.]|nr:16S rRNA (cytosine(967)-C(5))-methyltransferase RsmB [Candidatus Schmidhempelia sp.]
MKKIINLRAVAAKAIYEVLEQGRSLSSVLPLLQTSLNDRDKALTAEICFGILRTLPEQEFMIQQLMDKVMTGKNRIVHYLLMVGIYQLVYTRVPSHAAVAETVNAVGSISKRHFKGLINAILREFQRQQVLLKQKFQQQGNTTLHPTWLIKRWQQHYPDNWQTIIAANNQKPPMWLRVNQRYHSTTEYLQKLIENNIEATSSQKITGAIRLIKPVPVNELPGFDKGWVTVQDLSAQYAATLLEPKAHETILDLCAAPGGKTTHILEIAPQANVWAVDIDDGRLKRLNDNLIRLNLSATVKVGDGRYPELWCQDTLFDRILLDAPCSATGVIRRHPDIKWLRRNSDIDELALLQQQILFAIWPYLKPGGTLVYSTCSILAEENNLQIKGFLNKVNNAKLERNMIQLLPDEKGGDGFFYAVLKKET